MSTVKFTCANGGATKQNNMRDRKVDAMLKTGVIRNENISEFFNLQLTRDGYTGTVSRIMEAMELYAEEAIRADRERIKAHAHAESIDSTPIVLP